jgi:DNA-directed RNA polymerase specialized sigma24 family protein
MDEFAPLLAAARSGSADAFNELVAGQAELAFQVAAQHSGRPAAAAAERDRAFQAAWAAIGRYGGEAADWPAWLLGFVVAAEHDRDVSADQAPPPPVRRPAAGEPPADYGRTDDLAGLLRWALSRLPAEPRWLLVLDGAGLSYRGIGIAVGLDAATVKLRLARARADLASVLWAMPQAGPDDSSARQS